MSVVETRAYREEQANAMATQQANAALQQQEEGSEQAGMRGKLAPIRLQVDGLQAQVRGQQGTAQTGGRWALQTDQWQGDTVWRAHLLAGLAAQAVGKDHWKALFGQGFLRLTWCGVPVAVGLKKQDSGWKRRRSPKA